MKNLFKVALLAMTVAVTVFACDPPKSGSTQTPVDSTQKINDSSKAAPIDTVKKDTAKKQ